jgi:hypothetical protein
MAEKDLVIREKIDHSGLFDFPALYSFAHSWFKDGGYGVTEVKYSEKTEENKRDIQIEWKAAKSYSDYFRVEHVIAFEISGLVEVEAEIDGEKRKMNKGKISIDVKGNLIRDPESKWDNSVFSRFWRDVYNKYIIPSRIHSMKGFVDSDVKNFKEEIKGFLELTGKR